MPDVTVTLNTKTCWQGHFYAVPHFARAIDCPFCQQDKLDAIRADRDRLAKRLSVLHGVITRMKRRAA
jgi:hypothetical protein